MARKIWLALSLVALASPAALAQPDTASQPPSGAYFPDGASGPVPDAINVQADTPQPAPETPAPAAAPSPQPKGYQDVSAGGWNSFRQSADGVTTCGVRGQSSVGDPLYLFAATDAPGYITLQMSKPIWSIPPKTLIHLHVAFDDGVTLDLTGSGDGSDVKAPIGADRLKPWIHGFTAANNMVISFVGATAAAWNFSLTGTTPTIGAMAECAKEANLYLPAPYNTGLPPGAPNNPNGQPFAATATFSASNTPSERSDTPPSGATTADISQPAAPGDISNQPEPEGAPPSQASASPSGEEQEQKFIQIITEASTNYGQAPNQMAGGGLRAARAKSVCSLLDGNMDVANWTGTVDTLSSSNQGWGVLIIKISDSIYLATINNGFSDTDYHTLIDPNTSLFRSVSNLSVGDRVKFSGSFFPDDADCVAEQSLTQDGSMTSPDFTFRFNGVSKIP